jgi:tRNA dimethylallyltransferase
MIPTGACGPVVAVVGPTAVGKSVTADIVAMRLASEVVSADAMQVYRGMDIGTAKTPIDERLAPLDMVDIVDPGTPYSAALYQKHARLEINRLLNDHLVPVVCGGTGLYVRAALDDWDFPSGQIDDTRRAHYKLMEHELGPLGLYEHLKHIDPKSAEQIHPNNTRRVVRALEMHDEGISYADQKASFSEIKPYYETLYYCLTMDRKRLYERIDRRVDEMFDSGLLDEVKRLVSLGYEDALTSMQAIGYKELISYLKGLSTLDEALDLIKRRSRHYAKRQISWFKRDSRITWISMDENDPNSAACFILDALEKNYGAI